MCASEAASDATELLTPAAPTVPAVPGRLAPAVPGLLPPEVGGRDGNPEPSERPPDVPGRLPPSLVRVDLGKGGIGRDGDLGGDLGKVGTALGGGGGMNVVAVGSSDRIGSDRISDVSARSGSARSLAGSALAAAPGSSPLLAINGASPPPLPPPRPIPDIPAVAAASGSNFLCGGGGAGSTSSSVLGAATPASLVFRPRGTCGGGTSP